MICNQSSIQLRELRLHELLINGPKWETPTAELIAKVSLKNKYKKRVGSRAARKVELDDPGLPQDGINIS